MHFSDGKIEGQNRMNDTQQIIGQLTRKAAPINGVMYIGAGVAVRILGLSRETRKNWQRSGRIKHRYLKVKPSQRVPSGRISIWPLHQVIRIVKEPHHRPLTWHRWTPQDVDYLVQHYGAKSPDEIARRIGVTRRAVLHKAKQLGVNMIGNNGMWTTGQVAQLLGVKRETVSRWCRKHSAPHVRLATQQRHTVIDLNDLSRWLMTNPAINRRLPDRAMERLNKRIAA